MPIRGLAMNTPTDAALIKSSTNLLKVNRREGGLAIGLLVLILVAAGIALSLVGRLKSTYSISQFLPADHPLMKADMETRERFMLDQSQPILVTLKLNSGDWLETKRLEKLEKVSAELQTIAGAKIALSLGSVKAASQTGDQLAVGTLATIGNEAQRRMRVKQDRFLSPLLVSKDLKRTLVVLSLDDNISTQGMKTAVDGARAKLKTAFPEARISVGGVPAIQTQLSALVKSELVRFMGLALLACCLALLVVFSSKWSILIPFVAILATNVFVIAFMALAGISMTVLAVTIPILVSVTVLSLCIHTLLRFAEDVHAFELAKPETVAGSTTLSTKALLVLQTLRRLFQPNLLTSLTTCFGFATLMLTDVPVIREFGIAVAGSIMISWLCSTLIMLPLLALLPVPSVRSWVLREARWTDFIFTHARAITVGVVILCSTMALIGRNLHWTARLFDDLPRKEEARRATEEIDKSLGGTIPFEIIVASKGSDPWNEPRAIKNLDRLLTKIRKTPEVGSAIALPDLLRLSLGQPAARLPTSRSAIAENWFLLSMAEDSPIKKFISSDGSSTRIAVRLRDVASDRLETVMKNLEVSAQAAFPDAKISSAGMATTVHRLNNGLSRSLMQGFWEALTVITVLLAFVFRSWRWTLVAILPNLVPAAVLVGVLAIAKTPIKPGVALVFSIALGIAFNNTVYLLQRLRALMAESGKRPEEEIERALRLEGNPCLVASVCLLAGFGIFLLSDFGINRTFGAYMVISLIFGLVGDLVFMPALIRACPWILASTGKAPLATLLARQSEDSMNEVPANPAADSPAKAIDRIAASVLTFFLAGLMALSGVSTAHAAGAADADAILRRVRQGLAAKDEQVSIKMKVVESNGTSKDREIELKRKSSDGDSDKHAVLVRLTSPKDVSGIAVLSVTNGKNEDQWLYMPSARKARRVVGGNKSQRILDTEFSVEDFSASNYSTFENKLIKEERSPSAAVAVIESKNKGNIDSSYSKIMTWVDLSSYQVQKSEYYGRDGKLLKMMVFRDYKKFGNVWRAQTVEVRNMQNQRSTILKMASLKLNTGLTDRDFTSSALEED